MPKFIHLYTTTLYLTLLLHNHFTVAASVSVENAEINGIEELMESETSRRVLMMQKNYISYETLRRDVVPCAKPGASYYACHAGQAHPYNRGCEVITRCARDIKDTNN